MHVPWKRAPRGRSPLTKSGQQRGLRRVCVLSALLLVALAAASPRAAAQSWSDARTRPALWQIVAIDRTGELGFPYEREDIAGDGFATFAEDEAAADLRTVYADATRERSWLRAYFASVSAPDAGLHALFFIDADGQPGTGGPATGTMLEPSLAPDPTRGGYEFAAEVRGDGSVSGAWRFDAATRAWLPLALSPGAARAEGGVDRDPLGIGSAQRSYLQLEVDAAVSRLDAACGGRIFVRTWRSSPPRALSDDLRDQAACRGPLDALGDPIVIRSFVCSTDAECPADGRCRDGVCLFAYECAGDASCRAGERCSANRCVRVVDRPCTLDGECDGLVCEAGRCAACAELGTLACEEGRACAPNGACVEPSAFEPSGGGSDRVQGGAFQCAASQAAPSALALFYLLGPLLLGRRATRARASERRPS